MIPSARRSSWQPIVRCFFLESFSIRSSSSRARANRLVADDVLAALEPFDQNAAAPAVVIADGEDIEFDFLQHGFKIIMGEFNLSGFLQAAMVSACSSHTPAISTSAFFSRPL